MDATFTHSASISRPRAEVWTRLQIPATWELLGPIDKVSQPVVENGQLKSFHWRTRAAGRDINGTAHTSDYSPPEHFELALDAGEISGTLEALLSGDGETDLSVTLQIRPKGPLATLFFAAVREVVGNGFADHVNEFALSLEDDS
ncbi:MAG: SRPBCC family protein [Acidimicrobiia bacterium]|nr:SRPBCC family protein [Acidimicrobiia bacterium]MDH3470640.1 SRPBCC family protein [Acidimicrobiia bacterium]